MDRDHDDTQNGKTVETNSERENYIPLKDPWDEQYIYLHLDGFVGFCRQIYHTWILWVRTCKDEQIS